MIDKKEENNRALEHKVMADETYIDNDYFAWRIIEFMGDIGYQYEDKYSNVVEWLNLSSGVEKVEIFTGKYDEGILWCGNIYNFEKSRSELLSLLSKELVRFHFAWGALEALIILLVPKKKIDDYGKINALCGFLKQSMIKNLLPYGYLYQYEKLISLLRTNKQYNDNLVQLGLIDEIKYDLFDYVDQAGIGIYIVYKVRNKFAHGEMKFPYPEDYAGERAFDVDIIDTATRLVLMTIQILLLNDIKDENIVFDSDSFLKDATGKTALEYLKSLHIAPDSE